MNEHLNRLSDEYERRHAKSAFCPVADFKADFFKKARQLPEQQKFHSIKLYPWIGAAAALVIIALGIFSLYPRQTTVSTTSLLAEARRLLEPDGLGVAVINGELLTFERTENNKAKSLFEINLKPGEHGEPIKIQFACASGDRIKIDANQLKGEFWVYKVDKNLFALESNCMVKIPGGKNIRLAGFVPVAMNGTQSEKIDSFLVTRKVMPL